MYSNIRVGPAVEVEDPTAKRLLQIKPLKILGAIHIVLGVVIALLSTIGIIISYGKEDEKCYHYGSYNIYCRTGNRIVVLIFGVVCLILSGWFIMTGALPLCMTEKRERSWKCLKIAFTVCCILSAVLFGFTVVCLAGSGAAVTFEDSTVFVVFVLLSITSFSEVVLAIGTASYSCCCSQLQTTNMPNNSGISNSNSSQSGLAFTTPPVHMPSNISQGYPGMWLVPGQHGGQPVMYHVIGMSPAQGGTNHNTAYTTHGGTNQFAAYAAQDRTNQNTTFPAQDRTNQNTTFPAQDRTNQNTTFPAQDRTNQNTTFPAQFGTNQNTTYPSQGGTNQNTTNPSAPVFDQS